MSFYHSMGVAKVINAATTFTALGGSLMPSEVLTAMNDAAGSFIDMQDLHRAAGRELARLTENEAAYVTSGCAAALVLALFGIRTHGDPSLLERFPSRGDVPHEVVMHAAHRIPYDKAVGLAGCEIRQIGNNQQTFAWELEAAITDRTAAVLYVAGTHLPQVALPLEEVVDIAHSRSIPVIVDAAAQLPPVANLWHFTRDLGADLVTFSGGKALRGPQSSGLMLGRTEFIDYARSHGSPFQGWARALKVGKEEIAGLVAAVRRFVELDHEALLKSWTRIVEEWRTVLEATAAFEIAVEPLNEAGQPVPRLRVSLADSVRTQRILDNLYHSTPRIAVLPDVANGRARGFWLSPDQLADGEAEIVAARVLEALASSN